MRAITIPEDAGPTTPADALTVSEVPAPTPGDGEVLLDVVTAGVNRADIMQRRGLYAPPPGTSPYPGLEVSGRVRALGPGVQGYAVGDEVCALLSGGGYAEQVAVPAAQLLPVPAGIGLTNAAALPEVVCTVWSNLVMTAQLERDETLLVHGGSSGIGTMAIQVAKALGVRVAVTASSAAKLQACADLGADMLINYAEQDFVEQVKDATDGRGADVILDVVGAKYLARNVEALAPDGRLVVIGLQGGRAAELDLGAMLGKRASVLVTSLRSRPVDGRRGKGEVVRQVREHVWPWLEAGTVRPVIQGHYPLAEAGAAHAELEASQHIGKVLLDVSSDTEHHQEGQS